MDGTMIDLERIVVSGTASDMGEQYGEAARDKIVQFINVRMDAVNQYAADRGRASANGILDVGARSLSLYQEWDPEGYEEHMGIARGANVDAVLLYTSTNMTDMRDALLLRDGAQLPPDNEGCSAILIPQHMTRAGQAIVGQTWDLNPPDIDYVLAVHRKPLTGPQTWTVTCAGCLTLVGMNSHGISVGTTNIKTYGSRAGVGYLSILHKMIRARTVDEASQALSAPRSGATPTGRRRPIYGIETNPDSHALRRAHDKAICHTNHCLRRQYRAAGGALLNE